MHNSVTDMLVSAIEQGDIGQLEELLADGADPATTIDDARPPNGRWFGGNTVERKWRHAGIGRPLLHLAAILNERKIVVSLLRHGAPVDQLDKGDLTALIVAVRYQNLEIAKILLESGASTDVYFHGFPLITHIASSTIRDAAAVEFIHLFKAHGASIDVRDRAGGLTPLMRAARVGHNLQVRALIQVGADPNLTSDNHMTALSLMTSAIINGHTYHRSADEFFKITDALLQAGADPGIGLNPLMVAASRGRGKWIRNALRIGVPINKQLPDGRTALHLAAANGFHDVVRILLAAGASSRIVDDAGMTPLDLANSKKPNPHIWDYSQQIRSNFDETIKFLQAASEY